MERRTRNNQNKNQLIQSFCSISVSVWSRMLDPQKRRWTQNTYCRNGTIEETSWNKQKTVERRMKTSDWILIKWRHRYKRHRCRLQLFGHIKCTDSSRLKALVTLVPGTRTSQERQRKRWIHNVKEYLHQRGSDVSQAVDCDLKMLLVFIGGRSWNVSSLNTVRSFAVSLLAVVLLTPLVPAALNCCCLKGLASYWSNSPF